MFLRYFCLLISILIFSFSCTNSNKENEIISLLTNNLNDANEILDNHIQEDLSYLKEKTENPLYKDKALSVQVIVDSIVSIINSSEKQLLDASNFYAKNKNGEAFETKMETFYNSFTYAIERLWMLDSLRIKTIIPHFYSEDNTSKLLLKNRKQFLDKYSKTQDSVLVKSAIATLNFEIKKLKYDLLHFYCKTSICYEPVVLQWYSPATPIAFLEKQIVKPNEIISVSTGIALLNNSDNKKIFVNGNLLQLDPYGLSSSTVKASKTIGKHTIPVRLQINNPDGSISTIEKLLVYYVAE